MSRWSRLRQRLTALGATGLNLTLPRRAARSAASARDVIFVWISRLTGVWIESVWGGAVRDGLETPISVPVRGVCFAYTCTDVPFNVSPICVFHKNFVVDKEITQRYKYTSNLFVLKNYKQFMV